MENFNDLLLSMTQQNNMSDYSYNDYSDIETNDYNDEELSDEDDYTQSIISENEDLKTRIKEFEDLQKIEDTQDEYNSYMSTQDMEDPNYALQLVMSNDLFEGLKDNPASSATWLKRKDNSVNLEAMSGRITSYLESLPESIRNKLLATSGNDSDVHTKNSKHYSGSALDLRYNDELYNYLKKDPNFKKSGLNMLDPNHGTAKHIHIEEYKNGGKYIPTRLIY